MRTRSKNKFKSSKYRNRNYKKLSDIETINMPNADYREMRKTFEVAINQHLVFLIVFGALLASILFIAKLDFDVPSTTIYMIFIIFNITCVFFVVSLFKLVQLLIANQMVQKHAGVIIRFNRPTFCINKMWKELKGHTYYAFVVFGIRYAYDLKRKETSNEYQGN